MSRRPLDKEINRARRRAENARAVAAAEEAALNALLKAQAELFEAVAEEHRNEVLHNRHDDAKLIDTMNTEIVVPGARLKVKHPAAVKIRKIDGSIAKFATKKGLEATTVRSWYATGVAARRVPRKWVDILKEKPYLIPESAWKNGIEE